MNEEKKRILELVQNGKLSAQEAIILLEALEEGAVKEDSSASEYERTERRTKYIFSNKPISKRNRLPTKRNKQMKRKKRKQWIRPKRSILS
ncbi:hypothetical protein ACA29_18220 [Lederbergia galactosidilytica]|uniref:YvlB/LiaX N-terminal domain-containing protein n=1 Tax=Lederbergia galactosidilytica TaxID=217031 RepID=A0A0Q9XS82_9BACI|nr:hypothetical protein ACA29_18220 [Lederbergia galactosidilytica]